MFIINYVRIIIKHDYFANWNCDFFEKAGKMSEKAANFFQKTSGGFYTKRPDRLKPRF